MTSPNHVARSNRALPARRIGLLGAAAGFVLLFAPTTATLAQTDPVVAKVNGVEIHQSDVDVAEEEMAEQLAQLPAEARRDYLITYLADMLLVDKAADDQKLAQGVEFQRRLTFARNRLLMDTLMQSVGKDAVTDAALHKVYDEAAKQIGDEQEVHARHILVETEADAKAVLVELKKGTDFAALAKQKSKDPGAADGGDLGYFTKDQMVPEFAEVAFKLNKGQTSDPVKTQFGWHIIKVEDKRKREVPSFEQVKPQLESYLVRKAQADYVSKLRDGAKIERIGGGPTPPPGAPPKR
ncbi:MAG: peptidylprolyl isomerase [Xanthobacteraceae bacterium]